MQYRYVGYSVLTPLQVKIGITNNLEHRLDTFHTVDHSIVFVGVRHFKSRAAVFKHEAFLHRRFEHARSDRGQEWFHITPDLFLWLLQQGYVPAIIFTILKHFWGEHG